MKNTIKWMAVSIGIMLVACVIFGAAVMLLWNALLPQLFGLPQINYLQAAGLLILARLLFGGIADSGRAHAGHRRIRGDGHHFLHDNKLREKWMKMSEDELNKFLKKDERSE